MYIYYNPNPRNVSRPGDCTIRALSKALSKSWEEVYLELSMLGFRLGDMPSSNYVWGEYLKQRGFRRYVVADACPDCYTVTEFCKDNPYGLFVLATGSHVVTVLDGDYYDSWDSGDEIPIYLFKRR